MYDSPWEPYLDRWFRFYIQAKSEQINIPDLGEIRFRMATPQGMLVEFRPVLAGIRPDANGPYHLMAWDVFSRIAWYDVPSEKGGTAG